ncbi:MAG: lipoate--protein ligase family protein [Microbacteriaceae bacterium]|jgi:lipoate-protein ligase A|nr:lipoate--protein ligase family protein [Microbacteriaceae bacterium]MCI1207752.1 lipoate--protein ligase family protein [Microbacteriaceae bacterium]
MHGEYKVPGGKLVVVDLDVTDGHIRNFHLAGDFFLEPDDALDAINAAIDGLSANAPTESITRAIESALPKDAVLLGFSPESVAVTIRRAITRATTWQDYDWQLLRLGSLPPRMHLALDQVLTEEVGKGNRAPTLRFWDFSDPAVVIGSFQSVRNEVDQENAKKYGIEVVRRITGGGAMFMEKDAIVTYSIHAPAELVQGMSIENSYAFLDDWVLDGLRSLGLHAEYQPLNDIATDKGKIGGAAQKRLANGGVLHHVTMSYDMDADKMVQVLRIGREKLSDKGIKSAKKRVDPLRSQTGMSRQDIIEHLIDTFRDEHGLVEGTLTDEERDRAQWLVDHKFSSDEWLYRVP